MSLAEMVGAGAGPIVVIFGNLFVMCLEGLIVGIQVLRLEFYEILAAILKVTASPMNRRRYPIRISTPNTVFTGVSPINLLFN